MSEHRTLRDAIWARAWEGGLDSSELLVLLRMVEHFPRIFPGMETLSRWTRLDESTVRRALRRLEKALIIRTTHNPGRGNVYQFLDSSGQPIEVKSLGPEPPAPRLDTPGTTPAPPGTTPAPTPGTMPAEADPDLKQKTKQEGEAGGRELKALEPPDGARPAPLYRFREGWKPKISHRDLGLSLGLTEAEMMAELADCRDKVYERPIQSEDAQFRRELRWLATDKQTKQFREQRKANPHGFDENPGRTRRSGDPRPAPVFGRRAR